MSVEKRLKFDPEKHSEGFKRDPRTGEVDRLEYSVYLEKAEKIFDKLQDLLKEIEAAEERFIAYEGQDERLVTLKEIRATLQYTMNALNENFLSLSDQSRNELIRRIGELSLNIHIGEDELGIHGLKEEVSRLEQIVGYYITADKRAEHMMRNTPPFGNA